MIKCLQSKFLLPQDSYKGVRFRSNVIIVRYNLLDNFYCFNVVYVILDINNKYMMGKLTKALWKTDDFNQL